MEARGPRGALDSCFFFRPSFVPLKLRFTRHPCGKGEPETQKPLPVTADMTDLGKAELFGGSFGPDQ